MSNNHVVPDNATKAGPLPIDEGTSDKSIKRLLQENHKLQQKLLHERFYWILTLIIFFDAYVFTQMSNWAGALVIGLLEIVGVIILAESYSVKYVTVFFDKLLSAVGNKIKPDNTN